MRKMYEIGAVLVLLVMLTGCNTMFQEKATSEKYGPDGVTLTEKTYMDVSYKESNLARKSLAAGGAVTALKIVTSADPSTQSWLPTVIIGFGTFFMFDLPAGVSAYFHDVQKSLLPWSSEIGSETTILIIGTESGVRLEIANPELLIDIPGLKVFNPLSDQPGIKMPKSKGLGNMPKPGNMPGVAEPSK